MAMLAAIILAPLLLEDDYFGAAGLLNDLRPDRSVSDGRASDRARSLVLDREYVIERDFAANIARDSFDRDLVARANPILFSAGLYDCEHLKSEPN
jgi:hypothetical protein